MNSLIQIACELLNHMCPYANYYYTAFTSNEANEPIFIRGILRGHRFGFSVTGFLHTIRIANEITSDRDVILLGVMKLNRYRYDELEFAFKEAKRRRNVAALSP